MINPPEHKRASLYFYKCKYIHVYLNRDVEIMFDVILFVLVYLCTTSVDKNFLFRRIKLIIIIIYPPQALKHHTHRLWLHTHHTHSPPFDLPKFTPAPHSPFVILDSGQGYLDVHQNIVLQCICYVRIICGIDKLLA